MSKYERALYLCGVVLICIFMRLFYHQVPCSKRQAAKLTDQAVGQVEQLIKSQDATVTNIVTGAHKEVTSQNEAIRQDVQSLGDTSVADSLMALLTEYRRERGD